MSNRSGNINLAELYNNAIPTASKVLKLLKPTSAMTAIEKNIFGWLKRCIKEMSREKLVKLLQWMTGSDILLCGVTSIQVLFHPCELRRSGLARRPVARTCGPCVEL